MSARLFVDIDDTLILWKEPTTGSFLTEWDTNHAVVEFIYAWWREHAHDGLVTFWSTGGADYARQRTMGVEMTWPGEPEFADKYPRIPQPGDVFLDDDPLSSYAECCIHPRDLKVNA